MTNDPPNHFKRDVIVLSVLIVLHEICRRALSDGVVVSSLFAPLGVKTALTIVAGLVFLVLRLTLYVGVPGWLGAQAVLALARYVERTRARRRA